MTLKKNIYPNVQKKMFLIFLVSYFSQFKMISRANVSITKSAFPMFPFDTPENIRKPKIF